ncbi:MAG: hypothetical protein JWL62_1078 [Hyphomicrobiales bacterium]|nr:hypothetical protein [Hyphomicrobiales bacterium]
MAGILNTDIDRRIRQAVADWNRGDHESVRRQCAQDIRISSVLAGEWLENDASLGISCVEFGGRDRPLAIVDILDGLHHVTVLLHDGRRYFTLTIETDDDALARRIIICRGQKMTALAA